MRSVLFGVSPADPVALVGTRLLLGATALVACRIPARQGADVLPMSAPDEHHGSVVLIRARARTERNGQKSVQSLCWPPLTESRDGGIRTRDPLNPIQVRYRTALRPARRVLRTVEVF